MFEPGRRIVQTFYVGNEEPGPEQKDILEITLRPLSPAQTELTFTDGWNGDELDEAGREANRQAWNGWLDELEKLF